MYGAESEILSFRFQAVFATTQNSSDMSARLFRVRRLKQRTENYSFFYDLSEAATVVSESELFSLTTLFSVSR